MPDDQLFVFHEYGHWSVLTVATVEACRFGAQGGTASVTLEHPDSVAELVGLVGERWGPGTWQDVLASAAHRAGARVAHLQGGR